MTLFTMNYSFTEEKPQEVSQMCLNIYTLNSLKKWKLHLRNTVPRIKTNVRPMYENNRRYSEIQI